ncbi:DNA nucleotidylexotransferase-like isoform X2 [Ptychodera flava]
MRWFTTSMEESKAMEVNDEYRLPREQKVVQEMKESEEVEEELSVAKYACQRRTPLKHFNKIFTDALEILEKNADFSGGDQDYSRALAFRRASASLKALPRTVTSMKDVAKLSDIGKHCREVIQEVLEDGHSSEIENILSSQWFQTMKLFTGVYGCGPVTARKWYDMGCRTLQDLKKSEKISLSKDQIKGLEYYDDLQVPVTKVEAEALRNFIIEELNQISGELSVLITGGFIRGKDSGHDVDFLISHSVEGKEQGLLNKLMSRLMEKGLILHYNGQINSFKEESAKSPKHSKSSMLDQFEKCLTMFKLDSSLVERYSRTTMSDKVADTESTSNPQSNATCSAKSDAIEDGKHSLSENKDKAWRAIRVDFVVCPSSQYAYALLGWTGSRMFNRSIRLYSDRELNMTLTSHGLYDKTRQRFLPATSEREIFDHLKLTFVDPWERNC